MTSADWYFDFVSPFSYLQCEQLPALAPRIAIRYRPVLFAGLLGANGQKGPAEIPAKRLFTYRFCVWQARNSASPLKFPHEHPFNPLPLLRLAIACDCIGRRRASDLPLRLARRPPARPADRMGGARPRSRRARRRAADRDAGGEGRAAQEYRRGDRARRVRRADARDRRRAVLGGRRDGDGRRLCRCRVPFRRIRNTNA